MPSSTGSKTPDRPDAALAADLRDVDLIAAPWIARPSTPDALAAAIAAELGSSIKERRERPHGRIGYVILLSGGKRLPYIDLSVMAPSP